MSQDDSTAPESAPSTDSTDQRPGARCGKVARARRSCRGPRRRRRRLRRAHRRRRRDRGRRLRVREGDPDHRSGDGEPRRRGRQGRQRRRAVHRHPGHRRHRQGRRGARWPTPTPELPEIWIPDSPTWKGQLTAAGWTGTPIAEVLAQTPVGLIGGPPPKAPASWTGVLGGGTLAMADPSAEGASALALLAPYAEMKQTGETPPPSRRRPSRSPRPTASASSPAASTETDLSTISASSTQLVPATEQAYLAATSQQRPDQPRRAQHRRTDAAVPADRREPGQQGHPGLGRRPLGPRRTRDDPLVHLDGRGRGDRRRRAARPRRLPRWPEWHRPR